MDNDGVFNFLNAADAPLSAILFWNIEKKNVNAYNSYMEGLEIGFELSLMHNIADDSSYAGQLADIRTRLGQMLDRAQSRRRRYESVVREIAEALKPAGGPTDVAAKPSGRERRDRELSARLRNIIGQFRYVIEPNLRKAIRYVDKKLIMPVKSEKPVDTPEHVETAHCHEEIFAAPYYRDVRYSRKYLSEIYKRAVEEHILKDTGVEDFIYYFSGTGTPPSNKLEHNDRLIILAIFIREQMLLADSRNIWVLTSRIFKGVNSSSIRNKISSFYNDHRDEYEMARANIEYIFRDIPAK